MTHEHDFHRFPELRNNQMDMYYFQSPHKQITEDFRAEVIKVTDGDTIRVTTNFRDFDFPVRFLDTDAPELDTVDGKLSQGRMEGMILGEEVEIRINRKQRVDKWGRLLGTIIHKGININEDSIRTGHATKFTRRKDGEIPTLDDLIPPLPKL